jgi:hypothetical protein
MNENAQIDCRDEQKSTRKVVVELCGRLTRTAVKEVVLEVPASMTDGDVAKLNPHELEELSPGNWDEDDGFDADDISILNVDDADSDAVPHIEYGKLAKVG